MTGKNWRQLKTTCKTKNCFHSPPPGKDYCGPCWRFIELAAEGQELDRKRRAREEERAAEQAAKTRALGA